MKGYSFIFEDNVRTMISLYEISSLNNDNDYIFTYNQDGNTVSGTIHILMHNTYQMRYVKLLEYVDDEDIMRALPYAINSYFAKDGQSIKYIFYSNDMDIMEIYYFIYYCLCPITFWGLTDKILVSKKYMYRFIATSESRLSKSMDFNDMIDYMDNNL